MKLLLTIFLLLTFTGPLILAVSGRIDFTSDYRTANRDSIHIAPDPRKTSDAIIQLYEARAFNWRGLFAVHTWIAIKEKNADAFTVYQVIGWRLWRNLPPLAIVNDQPDRLWFNQVPTIFYELRGEKAEQLIPSIIAAAKRYPFANNYVTWPGPNSNTFPAFIAREVPQLKMTLPSNAVGKDYIANRFFSRAPSDTGYQFSIYGIVGITLARYEGIEINILGLVYGFSPYTKTLKLPGFGDIKLGSS